MAPAGCMQLATGRAPRDFCGSATRPDRSATGDHGVIRRGDNRRKRSMDGIHLLGEWYGCPADTPAFSQAAPLRELCVDAARNAGLTVVGECFYQFEPQGVTGA